MLTLSSLRSAPRAITNWAGITGRDERPVARILLYHGTPRSQAASLERELRWLKRRFNVVPLRFHSSTPRRMAARSATRSR
jgi:hypothetical protein